MALVIQRTARFLGGQADVRATFRIGDDVIISIIGVKGLQVRIAIQAPKGVAVHREEVYQALRREIGPGRPVPAHP